MPGKIFPLVIRALRVDSRDVRSHLVRGALAVIVLLTLITVQANRQMSATPGLNIFYWVCQYNYWGITFAAATFFANAITEEKEERSLALLKMAGVGGGALILGKWLPRVIAAALLLAIQYPFTMLCVTLGGLTWQQVSSAYISLLAHLFLVGNIGLLASVVCAFTNSAISMTVLILVLYHALPWAFAIFMSSITSIPSWLVPTVDVLSDFSDLWLMSVGRWTLLDVVSTGFTPDRTFYVQVYGNVLLGLVLMLVSWALFEPFTQNEVSPSDSIWTRRLRFGTKTGFGRAWPYALMWKDFHYIAGGPLSMLLRLVLYLGISTFIVVMVNDFDVSRVKMDDLGQAIFFTSLVVLWIELAVLATRVYRGEIVDKTWSTLCMLPKSIFEISYAKLLGVLIGLGPGIISMFLGVLLAPEELGRNLRTGLTDREAPFIIYLTILQPLLALHVASWIAVMLDWATWAGAIFIGAFIVFLPNFLLMSIVVATFPGPREAMPLFVVVDMVTLAMIAAMHPVIGHRLAQLRAQ